MKAYRKLKAVLDLLLALVLLVPLAPVLLLVAIAIRLESRGPAVYKQERVGADNHPFTIYKFRSMKVGTPVLSTEEMQRQNYSPFTRLGPLLRKSNLDELPQLFNILKGEMSFIGPRPALPSQEDVNTLRTARGVSPLRPGITGLAQVMGRDDLDTETKVTYDAEYARSMSLLLDFSILVRTCGAVLTARGNK
ncbi:MAG TPA: sugar transferase [Abditibacteriaceae bacterium]|jgi:lipopolysaccharide/colanic/teichoic acid biosynthesis glycosyltransferase